MQREREREREREWGDGGYNTGSAKIRQDARGGEGRVRPSLQRNSVRNLWRNLWYPQQPAGVQQPSGVYRLTTPLSRRGLVAWQLRELRERRVRPRQARAYTNARQAREGRSAVFRNSLDGQGENGQRTKGTSHDVPFPWQHDERREKERERERESEHRLIEQ